MTKPMEIIRSRWIEILEDLVLAILGLVALFLVFGCEPLYKGDTRKITAWGFWAVVGGNPVGIGYWHSERGPGKYIGSEDSAEPPPVP